MIFIIRGGEGRKILPVFAVGANGEVDRPQGETEGSVLVRLTPPSTLRAATSSFALCENGKKQTSVSHYQPIAAVQSIQSQQVPVPLFPSPARQIGLQRGQFVRHIAKQME